METDENHYLYRMRVINTFLSIIGFYIFYFNLFLSLIFLHSMYTRLQILFY